MSPVRVIDSADIPGAMLLKEAAGWNQTELDWANVMRVSPQGCFGMDCDGRLVATATNTAYGRGLAWIGMVLTDPAYRGRGFARRLMEHSIEYLKGLGVEWIKLDATDMGKPLYAALGFEDECIIERWARQPGACDGPALAPLGKIPYELDRDAFGADRAELLDLLAPIESAAGPEGGYAMGRPGTKAAYFGPCVSRTRAEARELLRWFLARHAGETVYWDVLATNASAVDLARESGFVQLRKLTRMAMRGAPPSSGDVAPGHNDCLTFGIAGFEFG